MGIKHSYQSATPNDGGKEISSTRWNEEHYINTSIILPGQATAPAGAVAGEFWYNSTTGKFELRDSTGVFSPGNVTLADAQTLSNKTLTTPVINGGNLSSTITAVTAAPGTSTTAIATTAFVANAVSGLGGSVTPGGSIGQVQYNNAGAFAGALGVEIGTLGNLLLKSSATPTIPALGGVNLFATDVPGRTVPAFLSQDGLLREIQPSFAKSNYMMWKGAHGATSPSAFGISAPTATGTATSASFSTASVYAYTPCIEYLATSSSNAVAGFRSARTTVTVGGPTSVLGGFHCVMRFGPSQGVSTATHRMFCGLTASIAASTDVETSSLTDMCGVGYDAADTNMQFMRNDASGTATKIDLGASFPKPTVGRSAVYELAMFSPKGTTQSLSWMVTNVETGATASGTVTSNLPAATTGLAPRGHMSAGGTATNIGIALMSMYLDPLL